MVRVALIGVAGAAGALSRYGIGLAIGPRAFPWATLAINVVGSFLLGMVLAARWSETAALVVGVGFLGAFTTFSTFTNETTGLLRDERALTALVYVAASIVVGVAAAAVGYAAVRSAA